MDAVATEVARLEINKILSWQVGRLLACQDIYGPSAPFGASASLPFNITPTLNPAISSTPCDYTVWNSSSHIGKTEIDTAILDTPSHNTFELLFAQRRLLLRSQRHYHEDNSKPLSKPTSKSSAMLFLLAGLAYTALVSYTVLWAAGHAPDHCKLGVCRFDGHLLPRTLPYYRSQDVAVAMKVSELLNYDVDPHASDTLSVNTPHPDAAVFYDESDLAINSTNSTQHIWLSARASAQPCSSPFSSSFLHKAFNSSSNSFFPLSVILDPKNFFGWCKTMFKDDTNWSFNVERFGLILELLALGVVGFWVTLRELQYRSHLCTKNAAEEELSSLMDELLASRRHNLSANTNYHVANERCRTLGDELEVSRRKNRAANGYYQFVEKKRRLLKTQLGAANDRATAADKKCCSLESQLLLAKSQSNDKSQGFEIIVAMLLIFTIQDRERMTTISDLQTRLSAQCNINGRLHGELQRYLADPDTVIKLLQQQEDTIAAMERKYDEDHDQQMQRRFKFEARVTDCAGQVDTFRFMRDEIRAEHEELMALVPSYPSKLGYGMSKEERMQKEKEFFAGERKQDLENLQWNFDDLAQKYGILERQHILRGEENDKLRSRLRIKCLEASRVKTVRTFHS